MRRRYEHKNQFQVSSFEFSSERAETDIHRVSSFQFRVGGCRRTLTHCLCVLALAACGTALVRAQVQTGPIDEPRGASHEPAVPPVKGAAAIRQRRAKCSLDLIVNADAMFQPNRWTLNPDGGETLDALGPMITKAGNHPARIIAYTASSESDTENRDVSERRALTVRTWLVNHQFLPAATPTEAASPEKPPASIHSGGRHKNGVVEVVIDTCH